MEKRVLTVEAEYCNNWTVPQAVRELIQNAVDTGTKIEITNTGKFWSIKDRGNGLNLSDFLIGRSSKRDNDDVIGQFGEGAPIGCLVLARAGRKVEVYANDRHYSFAFEYDKQWGSNLLTITIDEFHTPKGTSVCVECSADEMEEAKNLFLLFNPQPVLAVSKNTEILKCKGSVYVNGLYVSKVNSLFGYNFKGQKGLINRDRNAIGHGEIITAITETVAAVSDKGIIATILKAGTGGGNEVELTELFMPQCPKKWKAVINDLWGKKVCLANNPVSDQNAVFSNWIVLMLPWGLKWSLYGIIPDSNDVVSRFKRQKNIPFKNLKGEHLETLMEGRKIANWLAKEAGLKTYPIKIFKNLCKDEGTKMWNTSGTFLEKRNLAGGEVGLEISILENGDVAHVVGVLLHEYTHGTEEADDGTVAFENGLTNVIATLGVKYYNKKFGGQ